MKELANLIISRLPTEIQYGDTRVMSETNETIIVKNGKVENVEITETSGFGVRVLLNGGWGFASSSKLDKGAVDSIIKQTINIAWASGIAKSAKGVELTPSPKVEGYYKTPYKEDPFKVPLEEKVALLLEIDKILKQSPYIKVAEAMISSKRVKKVFASTDGSIIEQEILISGANITATAIEDSELQIRSYGNFGTAGYEFVRSLDLLGNAQRVREEAGSLLKAKPCPAGKMEIIIDSDLMVLQVHESIGHAVELDRVLGTEASYAGSSFVTIDKLNKFKYGSEIVNITADANVPKGLGTFGWDDEGVPAQDTPIIRDGIFTGYLSSRDTAPIIKRQSSGAMRASSWNRIPLIRMTNVNLEPGEWKLDNLIADTKKGLFLQTNKSWSIDDKRENFQFGVELAREIKNGQLGEIVKDATYTGYTPEFWGNCNAICNRDYWKMYGTMNCGKGEPGQIMYVGHGTTPARFKNVQVGVFKK
ncbi:MAG: TldD/PmbA family protein [Candidatus Stahlbacteria bacterium]|nr:TldD/PmbA family protein [Candidatus Stahlbacteria bacterium]